MQKMINQSGYIIRDFKENDFPAIENLWEETGLGGKERGDNLNVILNTIKVGGRLLVMEEKKTNELIGSSWMTIDGRRIYMHHFAIKPSFQRMGLGEKLLEESLKFAQREDLQIKIEVHKDNYSAIKLYKKHDFKYLGDYIVLIIRNMEDR